MATPEVQTALANEARRSELRQKISNLKGQAGASASLMQQLNTMNNDANIALTEALSELAALEAGAGPGVTADFGQKSTVTQLLEAERAAAKSAAIDFIKTNPACTEQEAADVWDAAAIAYTSLAEPLQKGVTFGQLYTLRLFQAGYTSENTWAAHRQWVIATPKSVIMNA